MVPLPAFQVGQMVVHVHQPYYQPTFQPGVFPPQQIGQAGNENTSYLTGQQIGGQNYHSGMLHGR